MTLGERPFLVAVSMQHLIPKRYREEDVDYETTAENLLHRRTNGIDVRPLAERCVPEYNYSTFNCTTTEDPNNQSIVGLTAHNFL